MKVSYLWDKFNSHMPNQDSIACIRVYTKIGEVLFAVCSDGVGSLDKSEYTAAYITRSLCSWFYEIGIILIVSGKKSKIIINSLIRKLRSVNSELYSKGCKNNIKLGATFSLIIIYKNQYIISFLGDSSIYKIGKNFKKISYPNKDSCNRLYNVCGYKENAYFNIQRGRLFNVKGFLLCTDGFDASLSENMKKSIIISNGESIQNILSEILKKLRNMNVTDDISCIYISI